MLAQEFFKYDIVNLIMKKDDFYPKNNENIDDLIKKFTKKHQNEKINSYRDLQDILIVELGNSTREDQAKVIDFIIENLCENGIISQKTQIRNIATILKAKFNNSKAMVIMDKLKTKVARTNTGCLNYLEQIIDFMKSKMSESVKDNSKNMGNNVSTKKNINVTSEDHKDDEAKNNIPKSVYERININQIKQNLTGPEPQIKIHGDLKKEY